MRIIREYAQFLMDKKINESLQNTDNVRLRFAPSPTGSLHCGGIRTCLYNYLFAKQNNGKLILRIEDTDSTRFVPTAEKYIEDTFDWLGIEFDESPAKGGPYGPYRQSERRDLYEKYYKELINSGKAYYAFDTSKELEQARVDIPNFAYDYKTRTSLKNSLTLSEEETQYLLKNTNDWVVRIKYPDTPINISVNDIIRGNVTVNSATLDDKVIWKKKDELPTYHLANIVDDHLMEITHVVRGEEWLPSVPLHIYLYDCFGWQAPNFAHLPLILGPSGSKLSKRDGDKYGFPVFPLSYADPSEDGKIIQGYKEAGYLPSAVLNILAFIGWNPGTEKEIYTIDELMDDFDLARINKAGAKFNPVKAAWFNAQHIKMTDSRELLPYLKDDLKSRGINLSDDVMLKILDENKNKVSFIKDIYKEIEYLFNRPVNFDTNAMRKWNPKAKGLIGDFTTKLNSLNDWKSDLIRSVLEEFTKEKNIQFNDVVLPLRLLLTGKGFGPSVFDIMATIGKDETIARLTKELPFSEVTDTEVDVKKVDNSKNAAILKEIEVVKKVISSSEAKLSNKSFIERAPADIVEKEKLKIEELKLKLIELEKQK